MPNQFVGRGHAASVIAPLIVLVASSTAAASDEIFGDAATLDRAALIATVLERNPTLAVARDSLAAAMEREPQARSLEDPMLAYEWGPMSIFAEGRYGQVISLAQRLPFPGKLALRGRAALAAVDGIRADLDTARLDLAATAAALWADAWLVRRVLAINEAHDDLVRDLFASARTRYEIGKVSQAELLEVEVELAHIEYERMEAEADRDVITARINTLLQREPSSSLPPPPDEWMPAIDSRLSSENWSSLALNQRPELHRAAAAIVGADAELALARRNRQPDFTVMGSYNTMWAHAAHRLMLGATVDLPIRFGRRRAEVAEAAARRAEAVGEEQRRQDDVRLEVEVARRRAATARHVLELHRDRLGPAARDRFAAAKAGFSSGRDEFRDVIAAARALRGVELDTFTAMAALDRRGIELDRALGRMPGETSKELSDDELTGK